MSGTGRGDTTYVDTDLRSGRTYDYRIAAQDWNYNESRGPREVSVHLSPQSDDTP